jgi:hypothetical protein
MQSIAQALMANAPANSLSAYEVGVIGAAINSQISQNISNGMSVGEAYAAAAQNLGGFSAGDAAALGVTASQNAVQSAINSGSDLAGLNPADVQAANDPIGGLISNLGLDGGSPGYSVTDSGWGTDYGSGYDSYGGDSSSSDSGIGGGYSDGSDGGYW